MLTLAITTVCVVAALTGFGANVNVTNLGDPLTSGIATGASTSFGFNASWSNTSNPAPASFALNGVTCTGSIQPSPSPSPTTSPTPTPTPTPSPTPTSSPGVHTMGYIGCSMGQNTAQGYAADGGTRMWGGYATGGDVASGNTTPATSAPWRAPTAQR